MVFTFCTVGIEKVLLLRSGRILQESLTGIAVYDEVSGAYMLSDSDTAEGLCWLGSFDKPALLFTDNSDLARFSKPN